MKCANACSHDIGASLPAFTEPKKTKRAGANPPTAPALSALLISERDSRKQLPVSGDLCHKHYTEPDKKSQIVGDDFRK